MGLPISGFPNMNAVSLEDSMGQNYVSTWDFLKVRGWEHKTHQDRRMGSEKGKGREVTL